MIIFFSFPLLSGLFVGLFVTQLHVSKAGLNFRSGLELPILLSPPLALCLQALLATPSS